MRSDSAHRYAGERLGVSKFRRLALSASGILLSAVFLWLALKGTDYGAMGDALHQADFRLVIPLLATLGFSYFSKAVRWSLLLRPLRKTGATEVFPAVMIGNLFNTLLPAQLGELVRTYVVGRQLHLRNTPVLATIVLEKAFDFLTVFLLFAVALALTPELSREMARVGTLVGGVGIVVCVVSAAVVRWTEAFLAAIRRSSSFLPKRLHAALIEQVELGASGLVAVKDSGLVLKVAMASIFQWGFMGLSIYLSLLAVGIEAQLFAGFVVVAFTVVGLSLPSSPGFVGTIQLCFALALTPYGVSPESAIAASVFWHVLAFSTVIVMGLVFMSRLDLRIGDFGDHSKVSQKTPEAGPDLQKCGRR